MKYVHKECIEKWIKVSKRKQCELCGHPWSLVDADDTFNEKAHHACHLLRVFALTYAVLAMIICLYSLLIKHFH